MKIEQFVALEDIRIRYFNKPYVLVPDEKDEKGYVLLREAIPDAGRAGIAKVVIRARQYLGALVVQRKIKSGPGQTEAIEDMETVGDAPSPGTFNFMDVLKKSVEYMAHSRGKASRTGDRSRTSSRAWRPRKRRAG